MSAVASSQPTPVNLSVVAAEPVAERSTHELEAAEQKRWMTWFGLPALIAAIFVGAVFGTGQEWYLGLAISAIIADIGVLIWLALSSDTNGMLGDGAAAHH
jgi:hypothetical protein